jgi:capsid protein
MDDWLLESQDEYSRDITSFSYDAVQDTGRRKSPRRTIRSEDGNLKRNDRKVLQATTRDMRRNFVMTRWAIAKHLDFVCDHTFQANTGDEDFDKVLADFVATASKRENFDVSGRYNLTRYARLAEAARLVDGDMLSIRVRGGYLQAIESDKVRNKGGATYSYVDPDQPEMLNWIHGVKVNKVGKPLMYSIHSRQETQYVFEKNVSADKVIPLGFYDRFDQVRGVSPLAAAIDTLRDLHESYDYALAKSKVAQLFAMAVTRNSDLGFQSDGGVDASDSSAGPRDVSFEKGPQILDLDEGEDAKFLSTNTPEADTQAFWQHMSSLVLKSLNIPYSFWEENHTNFFGSRSALILYLRSVEPWREDQVDFRNQWLSWRLKVGQLKGEIQLPSWFEVDKGPWSWTPRGIEYWNPQQEVNADILAIENKLRSRTEIRKERYGDDWETVVRTLAREQKVCEELGLISHDPQQEEDYNDEND